jgi:MFS family permease
VHSFGELLALRVGFAAAQATQNPICFSLIPELFPRGRNTAMAAYNAAIYCGRALSFAAVIIAGRASRCDMTRCRLRGLATCL